MNIEYLNIWKIGPKKNLLQINMIVFIYYYFYDFGARHDLDMFPHMHSFLLTSNVVVEPHAINKYFWYKSVKSPRADVLSTHAICKARN